MKNYIKIFFLHFIVWFVGIYCVVFFDVGGAAAFLIGYASGSFTTWCSILFELVDVTKII